MKKNKGESYNVNQNIIGKITYGNDLLKTDKVLITNKVPKILFGINALILNNLPKKLPNIPVFISTDIDLFENDIVNSIRQTVIREFYPFR